MFDAYFSTYYLNFCEHTGGKSKTGFLLASTTEKKGQNMQCQTANKISSMCKCTLCSCACMWQLTEAHNTKQIWDHAPRKIYRISVDPEVDS